MVIVRLALLTGIAQIALLSGAIAQPAQPQPNQPNPADQPPPTDQPAEPPPPPTDQPPANPPPTPPAPPTDLPDANPPPEPQVDDKAPKSQVGFRRNFAGSIQLDYMAIPTENTGRHVAFDGATGELSFKVAMDFNSKISASVKVCVACHGFEVGMAYFDLRFADELSVRVGRFTPAFGEFPLRHDPANHLTSDKPLPYDMGRMVRMSDWNEGVLPAPWVDNGLEVNGTHYFGEIVQASYAVYATGGPRAASDPVDFDFKLSRSGESYYIDNNSRPVIGGQAVLSVIQGKYSAALGASAMRGTYDPEHRLPFQIVGANFVLRVKNLFLRLEYLSRRTKMAMVDPAADFKYGPSKDGTYDPYFVKDGGYAELEVPLVSRLTAVWREDGLRRRGNVLKISNLRSDSALVRHTVGLAIALARSIRVKLSFERYDFSDFQDENVIHVGIAGPF